MRIAIGCGLNPRISHLVKFGVTVMQRRNRRPRPFNGQTHERLAMTLARSTLLAALLVPGAVAAAQAPAAPGMTLDQFLSRQTGRIMAADTDGDGKVSKAEMGAMAKGGRDPARMFDRMDRNGDGYLDATEIRAALTERFQRMDRNHDGVLTPDERMAGRMRPGAAGVAKPGADETGGMAPPR